MFKNVWFSLRFPILFEHSCFCMQKHECSKSIGKRKENHTFLIPRWLRNAARWPQDRTKSPLGRSWVALGPLLGRSWPLLAALGSLLEPLGAILSRLGAI